MLSIRPDDISYVQNIQNTTNRNANTNTERSMPVRIRSFVRLHARSSRYTAKAIERGAEKRKGRESEKERQRGRVREGRGRETEGRRSEKMRERKGRGKV